MERAHRIEFRKKAADEYEYRKLNKLGRPKSANTPFKPAVVRKIKNAKVKSLTKDWLKQKGLNVQWLVAYQNELPVTQDYSLI